MSNLFFAIYNLSFKFKYKFFKSKHYRLLLEKEEVLRQLLRKNPSWLRGHVKFGFLQIKLLERANEKDPRRLAAIRVSAKAIKELFKGYQQSNIELKKEFIEAEYLEAFYLFSKHQYQDAYNKLHSIISDQKLVQVDQIVYFRILETYLLVAQALEKKQEAELIFQKIPIKYRNSNINFFKKI